MSDDLDPKGAPSERALVEAYLGGDSEAFRALYRLHAPRLLRLGRSWGLDRASAEDVVQSVFLRVHETRDRLQPARPLAPWLVTIALNLVRDRGRKAGRHAAARDELAALAGRKEVDDPQAMIEGREAAERALRALASLPEAQREAVVAVRVGGLGYAEAAEALGRSETAIRQSVHRGLCRLLESLTEDEDPGRPAPRAPGRR